MMPAAKRIVLATLGSLGDLHPMLALGLELGRRGHAVTVASSEFYRERVEALGLDFRSLRPDWDPTDSALIARCEEMRRGPEVLFRELILPHLRDTYADLQAATVDADLMIVGEIVYGAPLIAEKHGVRWVSAILSPTSFFSAHDPSLLVNVPAVYRLRRAGWAVNRAILQVGKVASRHWWAPVRQLRRELGLRTQCDPVFRDKFAPELVLALFSSVLGRPQPDWPVQTVQPGFVFYDEEMPEQDRSGSGALADFLEAGDAPVVFTQGSTAVHNAGSFYETSAAAARAVGRRAVLIGAKDAFGKADGQVLALPYAAYGAIFPRAAAIVHQGGSGTTGQALRAGKPQLIVPYGWDQPDNGARVARLGAGICLERSAYTPATAAAALRRLLGDASLVRRAAEAGERVRGEDGLGVACDAIEAMMARTGRAGR